MPLKDQTAPMLVNALMKNWIYVHGTPLYLLTDQGSDADSEAMPQVCDSLGVSLYRSQGNGFAEGNIRTVKNLLRSVLLHCKLQQTKWRSILPELIIALNASESKAIKYSSFEVVFRRQAILPQDSVFHLIFDSKLKITTSITMFLSKSMGAK